MIGRWVVTGTWVLCMTGCGHPSGSGRMRVALEAATTACDDYCVDTFASQVFTEDGAASLGPEREVACGEDIVFLDLPAGTRVRVRAWVGQGGERRLEGEGGPVTVAAGKTTSVSVPLQALRSPVVLSVSPEPAWPKDTLTVTGTGFGEGRGLHQVELDGRSLDVASWSDDTVIASLHSGDGGGLLVVRDCGVPSSSFPVRVLVDAPGRSSFSPLGCPGLTLTGVTAVSGATDLVLAFACDDPAEGYLQRYEPASCAPFGIPTRLDAGPAAIAASRGAPEVFVATRDRPDLFRVPLPLPGSPPEPFSRLPEDASVSALAATTTTLFALASGTEARVWRVSLAAPGDAEVAIGDATPVAVAASPSRLFVAGIAPGGDPILAILPDDAPRIDVRLPGCGEPTAVATDGSRVAVACRGEGEGGSVVGLDLATLDVSVETLSVEINILAIAMDRAGDAAVGWDAGAGVLVAASLRPDRWHRVWKIGEWAAGGPLVRHPSQDRFLTAGPSAGEVSVLSPYSTSSPCSGGTD